MEISVIDVVDWPDKRHFAEFAAYFQTPQNNFTKESISDVGRVDTIQVSQLYSFKSDAHRYLMFEDDRDLDEKEVSEMLKSVKDIRNLKGHLCKAKDGLDSEYGVSPDHDPFHNGYTYLWCCDDKAQ
jgi:hypothetical protein